MTHDEREPQAFYEAFIRNVEARVPAGEVRSTQVLALAQETARMLHILYRFKNLAWFDIPGYELGEEVTSDKA
jgi:hypothetical protein